MKQEITKEQLEALPMEQLDKLHDYWFRGTWTERNALKYCIEVKGICVPLLSIGQLIQLLREKAEWETDGGLEKISLTEPSLAISWNEEAYQELADALWDAVKSIL